jgi:hypothetical protein
LVAELVLLVLLGISMSFLYFWNRNLFHHKGHIDFGTKFHRYKNQHHRLDNKMLEVLGEQDSHLQSR